MKKFLLFIFTIIIASQGITQTYYVRNYTTKEGLPSNSVRSIYKDSRGYLWIGTDAGLAKYDGMDFKLYSSKDCLAGDNIWAITEDADGNMWFGCYNAGLSKYNGKTFSNFTKSDGLLNNNIRSLFYSKALNKLFIGTDRGLSVFNGNSFSSFDRDKCKLSSDLWVMGFFEKNNEVYFVSCYSSDNIFKYDSALDTIIAQSGQPGCDHGMSQCLLKSNGDLILGKDKTGINYVKKGSNNVIPFDSIGQVFGMAEDYNGDVWLASWGDPGGIFKFNDSTVKSYSKILGIDTKWCWSLYYDKEQQLLWIGTLDKGLFLFPFFNAQTYNPIFFNRDKLFLNRIVSDNQNKIWLLGKNLVIKWDLTETMDSVKVSDISFNSEKLDNYNKNNSDFDFTGIDWKSTGEQWISAEYKGMYKIDKNLHVTNATNQFNGLFIFNKGDTMINSTWGQLLLVPEFPSNEIVIPIDYKNNNGPSDTKCIIKKDNEIWFGSWSKGLFRNSGKNYSAFNKTNTYLPNVINALCFDKSGNVIAAGNTGEIFFLKYNNDSLYLLKKLSEADGLQGNNVRFIVCDSANNIWVGTNKGLHCINIANLLKKGLTEISFYNECEGYSSYSANDALITNDGMLITANDGFLQCLKYPASQEKQAQNTVILKSLKIGYTPFDSLYPNQADTWTGLPASDISFSYFKSNLVFEFTVLNYLNPDKDRFRYKLEGWDKDWSPFSKDRTAVFANLPAGNYILHVEAYNINSSIKYKELIFEFTIKPAWWNTWAFRIIVFIIIASVIYGFYKIRIRQIRKKDEEKLNINRRISELEMKALQAQMNPHFIFNIMNSVQNAMLDNDTDRALNFLSEFSSLIRLTLDHASKKLVPLSDAVDYLKRYLSLEKWRFDNNLDISIEIANEINPDECSVPPMILQPFAENAIKHGLMHKLGKREIKVKIYSENEDILVCEIKDNGIGRKQSKQINQGKQPSHISKGIEITQERIKLMNPYSGEKYGITITDLENKAGNPEGTLVLIRLPIL